MKATGRLVRFGDSLGWTRPEHPRYVRSPPTPPTLGLGDEVAEWLKTARIGTKVRQVMRPADNAPVAFLQATWVLGDTRPESVPGICTDLLLAGYDSPSLRVLAGLTNAELERVRELLPQLFNELGLEQPTAVAAAWRVAQEAPPEPPPPPLGPDDAARSIRHPGHKARPVC